MNNCLKNKHIERLIRRGKPSGIYRLRMGYGLFQGHEIATVESDPSFPTVTLQH